MSPVPLAPLVATELRARMASQARTEQMELPLDQMVLKVQTVPKAQMALLAQMALPVQTARQAQTVMPPGSCPCRSPSH
jgi:hypothetical protein